MADDPSRDKDFSFARLSDLKDVAVALKIGSLEGKIPRKPISTALDLPELRYTALQDEPDTKRDLYVSCQLWANAQEYTLPVRTPWKSFNAQYSWNHTLVLPISYPSLLITAQLAFTIWDIEGTGKAVPVGGTTMRLFTDRRGKQRLYVHRDVEADPSPESATPSEPAGKMQDEMGRLEQLVKDHERKDIVGIDWLDRLAFRQVAAVHAAESAKSQDLYLYVELPKFDFPIVYTEAESPVPQPPLPQIPKLNTQPQINPALKPNAMAEDPWLWRTYDPDAWRDNPVQIKHTKLLRSERLGEAGRDLKPGPADRDRLNEIFRFPPTATLSSNDKDLLWRFRFSLFRSPRSLTKFLKCVTWSDPVEAKQAVEKLLPLWGNEVGIDDALELLGPGFTNPKVRAFAVKRLAKADDEELVLYLLQLVQALKFDWVYKQSRSRKKAAQEGTSDSGLADFLIDRAVANAHFGTALYWYLMIETHGRDDISKMYTEFAWRFMGSLESTPEGQRQRAVLKRQAELVELLSTKAKDVRSSKDVRSRKIEKLRQYLGDGKHGLCPLEAPLPLPMNAKVYVTGVTPEKSSVFKSNLFPLLLWFETTDPASLKPLDDQTGQSNGGSNEDGRGDESTEEEAITITPDYPIIYKNGDDLRQDQLVIQLFSLMDRLLRKENLDLRLLPYSVLATSKEEGMIQFVPSKSLAAIMAEHGSLQNYLRLEHANEGALGSFGIEPEIMETFVKSCAGYSVLTYILGVGDRHLDNLMLAADGHFFHVDFGYILGRDPKPYPPPVKVCKEMVDAMGGPTSAHYARFQQLAYTAFIELRKNANLILNLVALMVDAGIQDIQLEPDKAVWKVQEKFMLDVSEEVAIKQFEVLLNDTSYLTVVFDRIHNWAQYLRD